MNLPKVNDSKLAQVPSLTRQQGCWMGKEAEEQEKAEGTRYLDFGRACGTLHVVLLEAPSLISSEIGLQMFESLFEFSRILCQMSGGS